MRKGKRFLSAVLVLCLLMGLVPGAALAAEAPAPFSDVDSSSWFYEAVQYVYDNNLMGYTSGTQFSPGETTTRGMLVTILHRMEGKPVVPGEAFSDVAPGEWYSDAVAWASANGIVEGYNGRFSPTDPITREQAAVILYRYAQHKGFAGEVTGSLSAFPDAGQVSAYAVEAMIWAVRNGLITGLDDGSLSPGGSAVRAQVAVILARFHKQAEASTPRPQETPVPSATPVPTPTPTPRPTPTPKPSPRPSGSGNSGGYGGKIEGGASSSGGGSSSQPTPTPTPGGFTAKITGEAKPGATLTATPSGSGYTIQWLVDGEPVDGETGATYTVKSADAGATITARITYGETVKTSNGLKVSGTLEEYNVLETNKDTDPVAFGEGVIYKTQKADGSYDVYTVAADTQITLVIEPSSALIENEPGNKEVANALALAIKRSDATVNQEEVIQKVTDQLQDNSLNVTYNAVDVDMFVTVTDTDEATGETTTKETPLHAVGKTIVTLTRAALGIPDGDNLADYTFFAVHTNIANEEEVVEGEIVNGAYVRFELNGLSRIFVGNVPPLTVTFDTDGGTPVPPAQKVKLGGYAKYVEPPLKDNWLFAGWNHDIETENLFKDIKVTALWIQGTTAADSQLSGVWAPAEPDAASVETTTANGTVTLKLDETASYPANLTYTLTVAPMDGAVKYAAATTAEGAMASESYTELTGGSNPTLAADVTDASGTVRTSNTNLYIKWIAEDGTVLGLQSARLVVRTEGSTPGNYDTQTRTETIQVNRGLGRVAFYLTDGLLYVDETAHTLEDYEGNINGYLRSRNTGSQQEYALNLYGSFYNTFGYQDENGSYVGQQYGVEAYGDVKIVFTPFAGETFSGTPTVQASYYRYLPETQEEETIDWPVTVASATGSEIVLTCRRPDLDAYSSNLQVQVTLGGKTQTFSLDFPIDVGRRDGPWVTVDTWDEVLAELQKGTLNIGYNGTEDVVVTNAFTLEPDRYVSFNNGASLTIGNGGVVTVKGSGASAAQLDVRSGALTVANGGLLTTNSQDSNQGRYYNPQITAGSVIVQSGGTLAIPSYGDLSIHTTNGVFTLEQGGKLEVSGGSLRISRNSNSAGENVFAGTVTVSSPAGGRRGQLEVNDGLTVTATGSMSISGDYTNVHVYGGLTNSGTITVGGVLSASGRTENDGTISVQSSGYLEMANTGYSVYNSGAITTVSGAEIRVEGTVLNNTGAISGGGTILAGEHMDLTDYENGIEYEEVTGGNWTPSSYSHYKFVADPAAEVEAVYFMGEVSNQAGGTCTVTIQK